LTSWQMSLPLFICGVGMGLIVAPITDMVLTDVPRKDSGSASGLLGMTQQLGTAIGIALVAVVFFNLMGGQAVTSVDSITPALTRQLVAEAGLTPQAAAQTVAGFKTCAQDRAAESDPSVVPASCQPSPNQPANPEVQRILAAAGTETNGLTFSRSFQTALWFVSAIMLLVFLLMFYLPRKARHIDPNADFDEDDS
jgi:MFS family permease